MIDVRVRLTGLPPKKTGDRLNITHDSLNSTKINYVLIRLGGSDLVGCSSLGMHVYIFTQWTVSLFKLYLVCRIVCKDFKIDVASTDDALLGYCSVYFSLQMTKKDNFYFIYFIIYLFCGDVMYCKNGPMPSGLSSI